jgi:predicted CoA-binding protein
LGSNTSIAEPKEILRRYRTIAIVGLSREPEKDSYRVAEYLKINGYHIIPVNPFADEILGQRSYQSLLDIPQDLQKGIEVVDIFRPAKDVPLIVEQTIKLRQTYGNPQVIWMQTGIVNEQAAQTAREAGLTVVMDSCIMQEHIKVSNGS